MDLSGIIFVVLAVAWAVYLIPKALKHHDEVARTRSIDRFSTAMRVLARREPVNRRAARLVVTPARPADSPRVLLPTRPAETSSRSGQRAAVRTAARAAARRRRHILLFLLTAVAAVAGVAAFAIVPWWSLAIPSVLAGLYLVLCRTQVRRERHAAWERELRPGSGEQLGPEPRPANRVEAPYGTPLAARNEQGFEEISPDEDTVAIPVAALQAAIHAPELDTVAVAVPTVDGGSLWDPLPVTLPTYVGKSRASRTVRTIDLTEPGTWTSGRTAADSMLVEQAAAEEETTASTGDQRAVGS